MAKSTIKMFRALGFSYGDTSRIAKDLMAIAARCSYAIYVARENPFWDVNKSLLHLASAEQGEEINSSTSLSVEQKQRIQAHKAKALAILKNKKCVSESKCDILGHPAAVVPSHASLSIKDKARSVRWADMSGGKLTEIRFYEPVTCVHPRGQSATTATVPRTLTWEEAQSISDSDLEEAQNL